MSNSMHAGPGRLAKSAIISIAVGFGVALAASGQDASSLKSKYDAARAAGDWNAAEAAARQLLAMQSTSWEYQKALADAQFGEAKYAEALASYQSAISRAEGMSDDAARKAVGQMLTNSGNAKLKLHDNEGAIALYERAARTDPTPATAYFNLCATEYNMGQMTPAESSCDKAIEFDPKKADAYFIKGSIMIGNAAVAAGGKTTFPPRTEATLRKYLELAPSGSHVEDVKQMLDFVKSSATN